MTNGPGRDGAGNIVNDGNYRYVYDLDGRICAVENLLTTAATQYVYDAEGNRVGRGTLNNFPAVGATCPAPTAANGFTLTTTWLRGASGAQDAEIDWSAGSVTGWHQNVFSGSELLATYTAAGITFHLNDWLGTRRVDLNSSGQVVQAWYSNPWGAYLTTLNSSADTTNQHFTGQEHDAETGNDYFNARFYGSNMGRFISPDPSGLYYAAQGNPQSFNLYVYAMNNPLRFIDPTGLDCAYLNDSGDGIENLDQDSNPDECKKHGGLWAVGAITNFQVNSNGGYSFTSLDSDLNTIHTTYLPSSNSNPVVYGDDMDYFMSYLRQSQLQRNPSLWSMSPEQRIRQIALAQATICGGGTFSYAGKEVSAGVGHAFQGAIVEHDSQEGTRAGLLTEVAGGEEAVVGGGTIQGIDGTTEPIAFVGGGGDTGLGETSAGVFVSPGSVGLYGEVGAGGRAVGGGVYANITTNAGSIKK